MTSSAAPAPREITAPIILFGFRQPDRLARVCRALRSQRGVVLDERRIHLMMDGAVSPRTGRRYASGAEIAAGIAAVREIFPRAEILAALDNLGIARNIARGEDHAFITLGAECAYFFEDDLEPGPWYLHMLDLAREVTAKAGGVAHFAVYGDHRAPAVDGPAGWTQLEHHWAFGLHRDAWRRIRTELAPYDAILALDDYQERNEGRILALWLAGEFGHVASSQDAAKALAAARLGLARVNTRACFGLYFDETGEHFTPEIYRRHGFAEAAVHRDGPRPLSPLDPTAFAAAERERYRHLRRADLPGRVAALQARHADPDRPATEADLAALYLLLADRKEVPPEGRAQVGRSLREVRAWLFRSAEPAILRALRPPRG